MVGRTAFYSQSLKRNENEQSVPATGHQWHSAESLLGHGLLDLFIINLKEGTKQQNLPKKVSEGSKTTGKL